MIGNERRRKAIKAFISIIAVLLIVYLVCGTYARYSTVG